MPFTIHRANMGLRKRIRNRLLRIDSESLEPLVLIQPGRDNTDAGRRPARCRITLESDLHHTSIVTGELARIPALILKA